MSFVDRDIRKMVKEVQGHVPTMSPHNITLVLQHFDYDIELTVNSFLKDGGKNILDQWQLSGKGSNGKNKKKKNKKNKNPNTQGSVPKKEIIKNTEKPSATSQIKIDAPKKEPFFQPSSQANVTSENKKPLKKLDHRPSKESIQRTRTSSRASSGPHAGIDKSCKELQRHIAALEHSKISLKEHLDKSQKRICEVFKELRQQMQERETALVSELEKRKEESYSYVTSFNFKCLELKMRTDRVVSMSEEQVDQLRDEIKNLSVEHKHLDDIAQTTWFTCQFNDILDSVQNFGEVHSAKPFTVTKLSKVSLNHKNDQNGAASNRSKTEQVATSNHNTSSIIRAQSDSLTKYEMELKLNKGKNINQSIFENSNLVFSGSDTNQSEVNDTEKLPSENSEVIETVEFKNSNFYSNTFQNRSNNRNSNSNNNNNSNNNATRNVSYVKSNSSSSRTKRKSNQNPKKNDQKNETTSMNSMSKTNGGKVNGYFKTANGTTPR